MAQQTGFVQEGVDRVRERVSTIENDLERMQKRMQKELKARRKSIEKKVTARRKSFERRTERQMKKLRTELQKNSVVKRAQGMVDDATRQFEQAVDKLLEALHIASRRDLTRIDRKLSQINRKLRDLEKAKQGNGSAAAS